MEEIFRPATMKTDTDSSRAAVLRAPLWASLIATLFGIGNRRPGPGTWGSAAAILIWFGVSRVIAPGMQGEVLSGLIIVAIAIGIPAATAVARSANAKDPQNVVIDEVAGQWTALLFAPVSWKTLLAGFILFRGFDILKPPPVRQLERLPAGTGIVVDDLAAGVYSLAVMELLLHFGLLSR
jgi:phosphatidylglycerophosphatase A